MCGIAGAFAREGIDRSALLRMGDALEHRGPDGEGYLLWGADQPPLARLTRSQVAQGGESSPILGFAHRRLTIIDLTDRSDQPLVDASGEYAIAYNGEIYNYLELRQELEHLGHAFRSDGDTEVVLEAYREWGDACVQRFVGMWAFAILDRRRRRLLLSRDRFGIKPLFYVRANGALYFASEIKALLEVSGLHLEPDADTVRRFVVTGATDATQDTFFEGVKRLPAAHNMSVPLDRGGPEHQPIRYWAYPAQDGQISGSEAAATLRSMLEESLRIHARSDVPVGSCLSGGLDSSSIVCLAEQLRTAGQIPRYTHNAFGYLPLDQELSEQPYMQSVIDRTGARMFYVDVPLERFTEKVLEIVRQQDEPFNSTSIAAQWFVFEAAKREGMKVMLDGQGADEVLGGYTSDFSVIASSLLRRGRLAAYAHFSRGHKELLGHGPITLRHGVWAMLPEPVREGVRRGGRVPPPPGAQFMSAPMRELAGRDYRPDPAADLPELLREQTETTSLPSLLRFEDRNSMAHSIEARVPFLDHRLVEFAFRLPASLKINGVETKHVLREAMRGVLPEDIRARKDKIGFRAEPEATWLIAERHRDSLVANRTPYEERWFDNGALAAAIDTSDRSAEAEFMLWRAINAKLWLRCHWGDGDAGLA